MSSDSEDLDEEELLQSHPEELLRMALKEQSRRNSSYGAIARKSVANYVQPPKNTRTNNPPNSNNSSRAMTASGGGRGGAAGKGSVGRRSMDEDEDSEVEMLSISSGEDEDI